MKTTVFLCRASGEGSHNFRICREEADVWEFYEEMFGDAARETKELSVKHFRDPDQWSNNGTAYRLALYNSEFECWKAEPFELIFPINPGRLPVFLGTLDKSPALTLEGGTVQASRKAIDETLAYVAELESVAREMVERLNHATALLADAALSEDFDAEGLLEEIKRIEGPLERLGKTTDWQTVNAWYCKLCALCGVSDEDEINIIQLVEQRLALLKKCAEQLDPHFDAELLAEFRAAFPPAPAAAEPGR